jgi:predicted nucleic acid-binding protein
MQTFFVDAWYLIARSNRFDRHHAATRRLDPYVAGATLVTHDAILTEVLAYFSAGGAFSRNGAVQTVRRALGRYVVEPVSRDWFLRGLDRYAQRIDKEYSHVDCISMVMMEHFGITTVLSNDHHFQQAGFRLLNDIP